MHPETRFKEKVQRRLKKLPLVWFVKIQQVVIRGIPDILICANGKFIAWELKVGNNNLTALQKYNIEMINKAHGIAREVTPENLEERLEELCQALPSQK